MKQHLTLQQRKEWMAKIRKDLEDKGLITKK